MVRTIKTLRALVALAFTFGASVYAQDSMKHEDKAKTLETGSAHHQPRGKGVTQVMPMKITDASRRQSALEPTAGTPQPTTNEPGIDIPTAKFRQGAARFDVSSLSIFCLVSFTLLSQSRP